MPGTLQKLTESNVLEAVALYQSGLSTEQIAVRFGVTRQSIWYLLHRRNVQFRPHMRHGKECVLWRGGVRADDQSQNLLESAVRAGRLVPPTTCEECGQDPGRCSDGRRKLHAHHDDYNKPLEVRWLCQPCHHAWHLKHTAVPKRPVEPRQIVRVTFTDAMPRTRANPINEARARAIIATVGKNVAVLVELHGSEKAMSLRASLEQLLSRRGYRMHSRRISDGGFIAWAESK